MIEGKQKGQAAGRPGQHPDGRPGLAEGAFGRHAEHHQQQEADVQGADDLARQRRVRGRNDLEGTEDDGDHEQRPAGSEQTRGGIGGCGGL